MSPAFDEAVSARLREAFRRRSRENLRRVRSCRARHFRMSWNDTLTVVLSQGCGLGCASCSRTRVPRRRMEAGLLDRAAAYAARHFHSLSLTGGEPTDCLDLVLRVAGRHPDLRVNVTTHGEGMAGAVLDGFAGSPNLYPIVSLNGIGAVHDASRHPGSFDRVMAGVENLRARGIPFGVLAVVNQQNLGHVLSGTLAAFVDAIGACTLAFFQYYPLGDAGDSYDRLRLSSREIDESLAYRARLSRDNPHRFLYRDDQPPGARCRRALQISLDGEVSYCPFSIWGFDTIRADDSDEAIRDKFEQFRLAWEALTARSPSFCPLQSNTGGYIDFFTAHGTELARPTGILLKGSPAHEAFGREAAASRWLTPG